MSRGAVQELLRAIEARTGICLERGGHRERLERFLAATPCDCSPRSAEKCLAALESGRGAEREALLQAVTVGHTWFLRDAGQWRAIGRQLREGWPSWRSLRAWVPGCSTGEDAFSLAMVARESGRPLRVLGTDLNASAVELARRAEYSAKSLRDLPQEFERYFSASTQGRGIDSRVRGDVRFERHNLLDEPPRPEDGQGWDLIVCRHVLIYFRPERALETLARLGRSLAPGGWLWVGSSEVLCEAPAGLRLVDVEGRAALQRPMDGEDAGGEPGRGGASPASIEARAMALVSEGNHRVDEGAPAAAIDLYGRAIELHPGCVEAHLFSGIARHLADDPAGAVRALSCALKLQPDLWPASLYLALSYESLGKTAEARRCYSRLVEQARSPIALRCSGRICADLRSWKPEILRIARKRCA